MKLFLTFIFLGTLFTDIFCSTTLIDSTTQENKLISPKFDTIKESSSYTYPVSLPSETLQIEEQSEIEGDEEAAEYLEEKGLGRLFKRLHFGSSSSGSRGYGSSSGSRGYGSSSGSRGHGSSGSSHRGGNGFTPAYAGAGAGIIYYHVWHHDNHGHSSIVSTQTSYVSENVTITSAISENGGVSTQFKGYIQVSIGKFDLSRFMPSFVFVMITVLISCM